MTSFQVKIGWKRLRKRENKSYPSVPVLPEAWKENSKKITTKLKNTIAPSFQAKIGRKRLRKRENKNYPSIPFLPEA